MAEQIAAQWPRRHLAGLVGLVIALGLVAGALIGPWLGPHSSMDAGGIDLMDAFTPPAWAEGGSARFLLGTDDQGRDLVTAILFGLRISLLVCLAATVLAAVLGTVLGLWAGFQGGIADGAVMRLAEIQLTLPGLLLALILVGVARATLPAEAGALASLMVPAVAIGFADWPKFARLARATTQVERSSDYVAAARLSGVSGPAIAFRHILPNVLSPVIVLAGMGVPLAVISEATLSFLGVGLPPTTPSLGTLIRIGQNFLLSGEWWIVTFPAMVLVLLVLAANLVGDWLTGILDPRPN